MSAELLPAGVDVFLVEEQANPSTDYFVAPACSGAGRRVHRCSFSDVPDEAALEKAVVVFVRYVPLAWRQRVQAMRERLGGLVFFMDDDVLDPGAWVGTPLRYRYKLYRLSARHAGWLRRQRAALWVSTPWLQAKYARWSPSQLDPRALPARRDMCRVFYHGSASHDAEIRWLHPVMEQVLREEASVVFEVIGGQEIHKLYRRLPRVTMVHPMKWTSYQAFVDQPGRDIGLAPLLDLPFNRARSCTKFFDITRAGAAGIYAAKGVCGEMVRDGVDGVLLPMEPEAWKDAILRLVRQPQAREALASAAQSRVAHL